MFLWPYCQKRYAENPVFSVHHIITNQQTFPATKFDFYSPPLYVAHSCLVPRVSPEGLSTRLLIEQKKLYVEGEYVIVLLKDPTKDRGSFSLMPATSSHYTHYRWYLLGSYVFLSRTVANIFKYPVYTLKAAPINNNLFFLLRPLEARRSSRSARFDCNSRMLVLSCVRLHLRRISIIVFIYRSVVNSTTVNYSAFWRSCWSVLSAVLHLDIRAKNVELNLR
jgi:hypothetical protein